MDLKDTESPQRQTALVAQELYRYNIDIAALQETRLELQGTLQGKNYTFFFIKKKPATRRYAGVGFAIANRFVKRLPMLPIGISERLIILRIPVGKPAMQPTMTNSDQAKYMNYSVKRSKRNSKKHQDWFDENGNEMLSLLD